MQDLGLPDVPGKFGCSAGKKSEPPVFVLAAVDPLRIENRVTNQVERQTVGGVSRLENGEFRAHGLGPPDRFRRNLQRAPELSIARHDQAYIVTELGQSRWQRTDHISHAAHLHHRCTFGGSKENAHGPSNAWEA